MQKEENGSRSRHWLAFIPACVAEKLGQICPKFSPLDCGQSSLGDRIHLHTSLYLTGELYVSSKALRKRKERKSS